jgi:HEAT repeat protein
VKKSAARWLDQLHHPDEGVAHRAVLKLGGLDGKDVALLDGLVDALAEADRTKRFWAVTGIARLARHVRLRKEVVERLVGIGQHDPESGIRAAAIGALTECRYRAKRTLPVLVQALQSDPSPFVRADAATAIGKLARLAAGAAAVPALVSALGDPSDGVRSRASIALKLVPLATLDGDAMRRLARKHPDAGVRRQLGTVVENMVRRSGTGVRSAGAARRPRSP